jgi:branched-subunit amino acid ABC-type transport system permease component
VLGLLGALSLVLAVRLYFFPPTSAVVSAVVALGFALAALLYAVLTRAVIRRSRSGHVLAAVVCAGGAVFSLSAAMQWPDWLALSANLAAFGLLLGSVPPKRSRP